MLALIAAFIGFAVGAVRARRREGGTADILQWGAVHAILFGLVALFAMIFLARSGL